jgi:ElaB/YqjD/DUF883 family membrane-anchored ribosome-binding protein
MSATATETAKIPIIEQPSPKSADRADEDAYIPVIGKLERACEVVDHFYRALEQARKLCDKAASGIRKQPLQCAAVCVAAGVGLGLLAGSVLGNRRGS